MKNTFVILFLSIFILHGCDKDSDDIQEIREYSEQVTVDNDLIVTYLQTHTYNYDQLNVKSDVKIILDTLDSSNSSKLSLYDMVDMKTVNVTDSNGEIIPHDLYYLIIREGEKRNPVITDSVYVAYKGSLLDGNSFDERSFPVWLDLANALPGFREGVSELKSGSYIQNQDGSISYQNYGVGLFFMPSGLAYFDSQASSAIPEYSPLIFSVKLMTYTETDHDNDGILSINEDIDGDGIPFQDDTDGDRLWNMYDVDDDNDGVLTKNELDKNNDGVIDDTDNDGIPDYLDIDN